MTPAQILRVGHPSTRCNTRSLNATAVGAYARGEYVVTAITLRESARQLAEALIDYYTLQAQQSGAAAEEIARQVQEIESMRPMFHNRPLQGAIMAATVFVIGVFQSLIWAALVARGARRGAA